MLDHEPVHRNDIDPDTNADTHHDVRALPDEFGQSPRDQDLDLLIDRHGFGKLAAALTYAVPYAEGNISERVTARELDLQHALAIDVLQALRDVIKEMREIDPYFEDIRSARNQPPETEE